MNPTLTRYHQPGEHDQESHGNWADGDDPIHATIEADAEKILKEGFKPSGNYNENEIRGLMTGRMRQVIPRYGDVALKVVPKKGAKIFDLTGPEAWAKFTERYGDLGGRGREVTDMLLKDGYDAVRYAPGWEVWMNPKAADLVRVKL